jgi:hypothetical protein
VSFWIKPQKRNSWTVTDYDLYFSCIRGSGASTQTFLMGRSPSEDGWGIQFENRVSAVDPTVEDMHWIAQYEPGLMKRLPGHRWQLCLAYLDSDDLGAEVALSIQGVASENVGVTITPFYGPVTPPLAEDLFATGITFVLGGQATTNSFSADLSPCNAVLDEFAIADFGGTSPTARADADLWALGIYRDGRYYKGEDAVYTSPALAPLGSRPVRLLCARWTAWLPSRDPLEQRIGAALPLSAVGVPRFHDARLDASSLALRLKRPDGSLTPLQQGATLAEAPLAGFRFEALPRTGIATPLGTPALESPYLDDVTFAWQDVAGPRILRWEP